MTTTPAPEIKPDIPADRLKIAEAARAIGVSTDSIRRWILREVEPLPHYRIGVRIFISMGELTAWINRRSGRSGTAAPAATPDPTLAWRRREIERAHQQAGELVNSPKKPARGNFS